MMATTAGSSEDGITASVRGISGQVEELYQERIAVLDATFESMLAWLAQVEQEVPEKFKSHALSVFTSDRPEKRPRLGWATTSGATLRAGRDLFGCKTLSAKGLASSLSMTALPPRRPLANISNMIPGQMSPAQAGRRAGVVPKTPSAAILRKPETPKSSARLQPKTPGRINALRQKIASTPKRLFTAAAAVLPEPKENSEAVQKSATPKRKRVEEKQQASPMKPVQEKPQEKPRKRRLAKRSNSGFVKKQTEEKVETALPAKVEEQPSEQAPDVILPYRSAEELAQLRRAIKPRNFAFTSRRKVAIKEDTEDKAMEVESSEAPVETKPAAPTKPRRRIARRTQSKARAGSIPAPDQMQAEQEKEQREKIAAEEREEARRKQEEEEQAERERKEKEEKEERERQAKEQERIAREEEERKVREEAERERIAEEERRKKAQEEEEARAAKEREEKRLAQEAEEARKLEAERLALEQEQDMESSEDEQDEKELHSEHIEEKIEDHSDEELDSVRKSIEKLIEPMLHDNRMVETTALDWGDETITIARNAVAPPLPEFEDLEVSILDKSRLQEEEKEVESDSETERRGVAMQHYEEDAPSSIVVTKPKAKSIPKASEIDELEEKHSEDNNMADLSVLEQIEEPELVDRAEIPQAQPIEVPAAPASADSPSLSSSMNTSSDRSSTEAENSRISQGSTSKPADASHENDFKRKLEERLRKRKEERASKSRALSGFQSTLEGSVTLGESLSHTKIAVPSVSLSSVSSLISSLPEPTMIPLRSTSLATRIAVEPTMPQTPSASSQPAVETTTPAATPRLADVRKSRARVPEGKRALPTRGVKRSHIEIDQPSTGSTAAAEQHTPAVKKMIVETMEAEQSKPAASVTPSAILAAAATKPSALTKPKPIPIQMDRERKEKEEAERQKQVVEKQRLENEKKVETERREKEEREKKAGINDRLERVRLNREKREEERLKKLAEMEAQRKKKEEEIQKKKEEQKKRLEEKAKAELAQKRQREAEERERAKKQQELMEKRKKAEEEALERERKEKERKEREEREKRERLEREREEKERRDREERERIERAVQEKRKRLEEERKREEEKAKKLKDEETLNRIKAMMAAASGPTPSMHDQEIRRKREEEEEKRKRLEEVNVVKSKGLSQMVASIFGRGNPLPPSSIPAPPGAAQKPAKKKTSTELMPPPKLLPAHKPSLSTSFSSSSLSSSPISSTGSSLGSFPSSPFDSPRASNGEALSPFQSEKLFRNEFALPKSPARNPLSKPRQAKEEPEQYTISPYQSSDEEDEDEDDDRKPKKFVPEWARPAQLKAALRQQIHMDPDELFGAMESPNLEAIFNYKRERFANRRESGNWSEDRVSWKEQREYKLRMQRLREWGLRKQQMQQQDL